jgi:hypothetical protein
MNTTTRIETRVNQTISMSSDTAKLIEQGKTNWLQKRDEVVYAKGKRNGNLLACVACTL